MGIHVALNHKTRYCYSRPISLSPQIVRLIPAPHARTPILAYSLTVAPKQHFINRQQDPHGNFLARLVFPEPTSEFTVEVDLIADMTVINPFDFFLEQSAETFPFSYAPENLSDLVPYLDTGVSGPSLRKYVQTFPKARMQTISFLVEVNRKLRQDIAYIIRMEPGVQDCEETLAKKQGSCRDSAWLLVQVLRHMGLAARFVSGYLIQLCPDQTPREGPPGPTADFTDLHAWAEAFIPGAGWIGLDPTSGLMAGEGHIPLAATPHPSSASPITGFTESCEVAFDFSMKVSRVAECPRSTKPYSSTLWQELLALGELVENDLQRLDVRLTMGGEPTFVSVDDMDAPEWNTDALGPEKARLGFDLLRNLFSRWGHGGFLHFGQGKWYPGEPLPRWAMACFWRTDGCPVWKHPDLLADPSAPGPYHESDARDFMAALVGNLGGNPAHILPAYEDPIYHLWQERQLPIDADQALEDLNAKEARIALAEKLESKMGIAVGFVFPVRAISENGCTRWESGTWSFLRSRLFLLPGDSPLGFRLPLDSFSGKRTCIHPMDPFAPRAPLVRIQTAVDATVDAPVHASPQSSERSNSPVGFPHTALCLEVRQGRLHVFLPPVRSLEEYLDLLERIEKTAVGLGKTILLEGYPPPWDYRLRSVKVTPDPGVLEVNIPPASTWKELVTCVEEMYEAGREVGLGAEKFMLDGRHSGTGGGNHIVLGGATPADSPLLRRPDLLRSLIGYWHNHPSLSYLFSGLFVGPTSQAPRVDESRVDALYELEIAFRQIEPGRDVPPWFVDRLFRHLLVDGTGNTHRAEFCVDKLFSPDHASGRLGLVEIRSFEMPPHPRMCLAQQLLVRSLMAAFWQHPYTAPLVRWGTSCHDRFMLPWFIQNDHRDVLHDLKMWGYSFPTESFLPHWEFRFPLIGTLEQQGIKVELRQAVEPWYVLGEEPGTAGTTRFVDSSLERLQVRAEGLSGNRFILSCNGRKIPLQPTGTQGEGVAGVRYRAWQPPSCLHPTIPVTVPLVFDFFDTWSNRSLGGCIYHVAHPGGRNFEEFPRNSLEAEARRTARFFQSGHTPGTVCLSAAEEPNPDFPFTLDLRRG
jgi:uncharacterized protein (DUF2126 family)